MTFIFCKMRTTKKHKRVSVKQDAKKFRSKLIVFFCKIEHKKSTFASACLQPIVDEDAQTHLPGEPAVAALVGGAAFVAVAWRHNGARNISARAAERRVRRARGSWKAARRRFHVNCRRRFERSPLSPRLAARQRSFRRARAGGGANEVRSKSLEQRKHAARCCRRHRRCLSACGGRNFEVMRTLRDGGCQRRRRRRNVAFCRIRSTTK